MEYKIGVLGAGSCGSGLTVAFSHIMPITLWARDSTHVENMLATRTNPNYIPAEIKFSANVQISSNIDLAIVDKDLIIIAVPLSGFRDMLLQIKARGVDHSTNIMWVCKGLEIDSALLPHQIVLEELRDFANTGALLGPSFAKEVARGMPTALSIASNNSQFAQKWIERFKPIPSLRVYANTDVIGAEVASAVKNIVAIAVGISDGLGLGYNARAALMTRSLSELAGMVSAMGGCISTIYGLTGVGDLILTCTSDLSRNRTVGLELARGKPCAQILKQLGHVAEGVYAALAVYKLSKKLGLDMPIIAAVYSIIYEAADIGQVVDTLLNRAPRFEAEDLIKGLKQKVC